MEKNRRVRFLLQSLTSETLDGDAAHEQMLASKEMRGHLRWMKQKYGLGQDMCLLGGYGPLRRWLALRFCQDQVSFSVCWQALRGGGGAGIRV